MAERGNMIRDLFDSYGLRYMSEGNAQVLETDTSSRIRKKGCIIPLKLMECWSPKGKETMQHAIAHPLQSNIFNRNFWTEGLTNSWNGVRSMIDW